MKEMEMEYAKYVRPPSLVIEQKFTMSELDRTPSDAEIDTEIAHMKKNKAPGGNGITVELLQVLEEDNRKELREIIKKHWELGDLPREWKEAVLVPLYKGKGSQSDLNNFRFIALLDVCGKVMAGLVAKRVRQLIRKNMGGRQHGFREGKSTIDATMAQKSIAEQRRSRGLETHCAFIDLHKAFDSIPREVLFEVLKAEGLPEKMMGIIKSMHTENEAKVKWRNQLSGGVKLNSGVRQGCKAAPLLFIVFMEEAIQAALKNAPKGVKMMTSPSNGILRETGVSEEIEVNAILFADDVLLVAGSNEELQELVDRVVEEFSARGLMINKKKTEYLIQNKKGAEGQTIRLGGEEVKDSKKVKHLGTIKTADLSDWEDVKYQAAKAYGLIKQAKGKIWRNKVLKQEKKVKLYLSVGRSRFLYGCETWTENNQILRKLEGVQNSFLANIVEKKYDEHLSAEETRRKLRVHTIESVVRTRRLKYLQRLQNGSNDNFAKLLIDSKSREGKAKIGRPFTNWKQLIREDIKWAADAWGEKNDIKEVLIYKSGSYEWKYDLSNLQGFKTEAEAKEELVNPTLGCLNPGCSRIFSSSQALAGHSNHCQFGGRIAGRSLPTVRRKLEEKNKEEKVAKSNIRELLFKNAKR